MPPHTRFTKPVVTTAITVTIMAVGVWRVNAQVAQDAPPTPTPTSISTPSSTPTPLQQVASMTHPPLNEISGIVRSRTYPDVWWVHNDGDNTPHLYAIDSRSRIIMPQWRTAQFFANDFEEGKQSWPGIEVLNSDNVDWEDIAIDGDRLYIADVGNNGNARRDLGIYIIDEPNPSAIDTGTRAIRFVPIAYPEQQFYPPSKDWYFDCEAVFVYQTKLYLLTKHRANARYDEITFGTNLYRLDTMNSDLVNTLTLVSRHEDLEMAPTAADLSPDGRQLAVLSYDAVWIFEQPVDRSDHWLSGSSRRFALSAEQARQIEAICWDDDHTLRMTNEQRDVFILDVDALQPGP